MKPSVFVVGTDSPVKSMFREEGWVVANNPHDATVVCFTGGADIQPELYGQKNEGLSFTNPSRDETEVTLYNRFKDKQFVGICRGGQLLNVLSGGSMIQDLSKMHSGRREVRLTDRVIKLHEDHHQGMVPGIGAKVIGADLVDNNPEILWYDHTRALCFQAHPEWGCKDTRGFFFELVGEYLDLN